jgi:hypothetical protein
VAGPAPDLEHPGALGHDRGDVGGDAPVELAEQEPAEGVVEAGIANEDASGHLVPLGGMAAVAQDRRGCGGRAGQEHELSRLDHQTSTGNPTRCCGGRRESLGYGRRSVRCRCWVRCP